MLIQHDLSTTNTSRTTSNYDRVIRSFDPDSASGVGYDVACEPRLLISWATPLQIPPMFSAIKMKGVKLYDMAREGLSVERWVQRRPARSN